MPDSGLILLGFLGAGGLWWPELPPGGLVCPGELVQPVACCAAAGLLCCPAAVPWHGGIVAGCSACT